MHREALHRQYDFTGRTVAITGGAGALGGEMAVALAGLGANVAILDRARELGERIVQRIAAASGAGRARFVQTDVLDRASLVATEAAIRSELGPVDSLINAAGGNHPSATTGSYGAGHAPEPSFFDLTEPSRAAS